MLNAKILGQDSNLAAIYKGKAFWIWGDSFLPTQYHGNFSVAGATTELPVNGGLNPNTGMDYDYFTNDKGASKPMIHLESPGYVWFDWLMNIKDDYGQERLVAKYANVNAFFGNYERGVAIYNDEKEIFESYRKVDEWMPYQHSCQHPFKAFTKGQEYYYLTGEFNFQRVVPQLDSLSTPNAYESFSCLKQGTKFDLDNLQLDRNKNGELVYGWKKNTGFIDIHRQAQLITSGKIGASEALIQLEDIENGEKADIGRGSIFWNEYRKKWILISGSKDIWYSEADTSVGPWVYARKAAEHQSFFYNPVHHPFLDQKGGAELFFEGTFTKFFSKEEVVPRYDYNQMFYKLSLENEQTFLPSPVYRLGKTYRLRETLPESVDVSHIDEISFFAMAPNRTIKGLVPVYAKSDGKGLTLKNGKGEPLFYALPSKKDKLAPFLGLWENQIQFAAFENSFIMDIQEENGQLKVRSDKPSFKLSDPSVKKDTLYFTLDHREGIHHLKATVSAGTLNGSWAKKNVDFVGQWNGLLRSERKWWGQYSPSVILLYEYQNKSTGEMRYSTDANYSASGFSKKKPFCRVWKNPSENNMLDFKTKPVTTTSIY